MIASRYYDELTFIGKFMFKYTNVLSKICRNRILYFILAHTWGLPMTLIGYLVALVLLIIGKRPTLHRYGIKFEFGQIWGGFSIGTLVVTDITSSISVFCHEQGHAVQGVIYGPLMPFIISIPSCIRYWYYIKANTTKPYDAIWFEASATEIGSSL